MKWYILIGGSLLALEGILLVYQWILILKHR
jgi:hypothetical protein